VWLEEESEETTSMEFSSTCTFILFAFSCFRRLCTQRSDQLVITNAHARISKLFS
jgi:hypothetical protein